VIKLSPSVPRTQSSVRIDRKSGPVSCDRRLSAARVASLLLPPLAVMAAIFLLSAQPSGGDHTTFDLLIRKLGHVTEYTVLTLCWWRALRGLGLARDNRTALVLAVAIALAYSASDEFHQTFVDGRHGTPVDVLIDAIGMTIAAVYARRRSLGPSRPRAA
jgi:VanZ family protein